MRTILLATPILLGLLVPASLPAAIVADHTTTDLADIPTPWINTAKSTLRLSYGHTSHGSQPVEGMKVLASNATYGSLYALNTDGTIVSGVLSLHDYTPDGDLGHSGDTAWATATRNYLDSGTGTGATRNVVIWSWCGGVSDNTNEGIDTYLNTMNQLEQEYPHVTFVYMTGHLDGTGNNGTLNTLNNRIRQYCQTNNKVLFDFADIESYDPDGYKFIDLNANDNCDYDGGHNWATAWCDGHPGHELCTPVSDCAHSQSLNCNLKARAFWWMLARIAGWGGSSSGDTTAPVLSNGTPTGEIPQGTTQTTLAVTTNENATCRFSTTAGTNFANMGTTFSSTGNTYHQHNLSNLENQKTYTYYIRCRDAASNSNASDYTVSFSLTGSASKKPVMTPQLLLLLGH